MQLVRPLEEAWDAVRELLRSATAAQWEADTLLPGWRVADIAAHLAHIEGMVNGHDQPAPPADFDPDRFEGLSVFTEAGVAARRTWDRNDVLRELEAAVTATLEAARQRDDAGWQEPTWSPVGIVPAATAAEIRLADVYTHLLDLRLAVGEPIDWATEPEAATAVISRAIRLTGWGAVKGAGLGDGTRIRLDLSGPGGTRSDLVVEGARGRLESPTATDPDDRIAGSGLAYLLAVGGRDPTPAGGLSVDGPSARRLIDGYRLFL